MCGLTLNLEELSRWRNDNGDSTHNLQYPFNSDSVIMDLGGFKGIWAQQMIDLYNPNVYIIEPVNQFYSHMVDKFTDNPKVRLMNVGVSVENKESVIYINDDTSSCNSYGVPTPIKLLTLQTILDIWKLNRVDLLQINIEGDEYSLLEQITDNDVIDRFKYIQVQFHKGIDHHVERRDAIRDKLHSRGFKNRFNYDFVWEGWEKINN
jgi:hypothetical protein